MAAVITEHNLTLSHLFNFLSQTRFYEHGLDMFKLPPYLANPVVTAGSKQAVPAPENFGSAHPFRFP